MKCRFITTLIIILLIQLVSTYLVTVFCSVYIQSSMGWLYGGVISIIGDLIVLEPLLILLLAILRIFSKIKCCRSMFIGLYKIVWFLKE